LRVLTTSSYAYEIYYVPNRSGCQNNVVVLYVTSVSI
jgi:hypothetical protein